jgi:aminopeptidase-like protein
MRSMRQIISMLYTLRLAPNSAGLNECVRILQEELPFTIHEFKDETEVNGWIIPKKWEVLEAKIRDTDGRVIYDGMKHILAVIGYSQSFVDRISLAELKKHLFYTEAFDDALVYHCDLFYKPFRKEWGFSVPKRFYDSLKDGEFDIELRTSFEEGSMKVAEYVLEGESPYSIILNAHNCHASCCNDDLSGVAVGIEVMRRLSEITRRRFTYRLVVAPEHYGSIFYLNRLSDEEVANIKWGIFLEMLGNDNKLALQRSFTGTSLMDRALSNALEWMADDWWTAPFRKIVGNDETCWEAAGYEIPFPSLSRSDGKGHFPEYHTSLDCPELINEARLEEAVRVVLDTLYILENDSIMKRNFKGLIALSHPKYDLYKPFADPSEPDRRTISEMQRKWNYLMDCLPRYFDGETRILEIAERHKISFRNIFEYINEFEKKGMLELIHAPPGNPVHRELPPV